MHNGVCANKASHQGGFLIENLNGKCRDQCLNQHWFRDIDDARRTLEAMNFPHQPRYELGGTVNHGYHRIKARKNLNPVKVYRTARNSISF